jgi:hypothetical protein
MCDDIARTMTELGAKGAEFTGPAVDRGYGIVATMKIPGGVTVDVYEPRHPAAI